MQAHLTYWHVSMFHHTLIYSVFLGHLNNFTIAYNSLEVGTLKAKQVSYIQFNKAALKYEFYGAEN